MSYLVDTCGVSELTKARPDPAVVRWMESVDEERLYLSVITLGELEKGVAKLAQSPRREKLEAWLRDDLRHRFEGRILPVDEQIAVLWGRMQAQALSRGNVLPVTDSLIAATAQASDLIVVTHNVADFAETGVRVFDPWNRTL